MKKLFGVLILFIFIFSIMNIFAESSEITLDAANAANLPSDVLINRYGKTNAKINFREGPSKKSNKVNILPSEKFVYLIANVFGPDDSKMWTKVIADGKEGYIQSNFVDMLSKNDSDAYNANMASPAPVFDTISTPEPTAIPTPEPTIAPTAEPTAIPYTEPTPIPISTPEPTAPPPAHPFEGFTLRNNVLFGEYLETVREKETLGNPSENGSDSTLTYSGTVASYNGTLEYSFDGINGLTDMCYEINESRNSSSHESIYESLKTSLVKKYGSPLNSPSGKTHVITGKAFENASSLIVMSQLLNKTADIFDYDEWYLEYGNCAVKIDLVDFYWTSSQRYYDVYLSYHFVSSEEIQKVIQDIKDKTEAIDNDI